MPQQGSIRQTRCECDTCITSFNPDGSHGVYRSLNEHHLHQVRLEHQRREQDDLGANVVALTLMDEMEPRADPSMTVPSLASIIEAAQSLLSRISSGNSPHTSSIHSINAEPSSNEEDLNTDTSELEAMEVDALGLLEQKYSTHHESFVHTENGPEDRVDAANEVAIKFDCGMFPLSCQCLCA